MPDKISQEEVANLVNKYKSEMKKQLGVPVEEALREFKRPVSKEYTNFKAEYLPKHMTYYEQACNISEKILNMKPDPKKAKLIQESLDACHLSATPTGVASFGILGPVLVIFAGIIITFLLSIMTGEGISMFMIMFFMMAGGALMLPLNKYPDLLANMWRMKASNQMVLSVFYVASSMRHTPNLELAIEFASRHLAPPLSLDLKKVLWDVETEKCESIKESLDLYLEGWRKWNMEYIEAMHLIESSLYESSEDRRLTMIDKALTVILQETYEKMLHYAHNLKSPITMLHMMGIILPILGLVILPLMVSFMEGVRWYHIAMIYNVGLPITIYLMGRNILATRPSGYGSADISEDNPDLKKYKKMNIDLGIIKFTIEPLWLCVTLAGIFLLIGASPLMMHWMDIPDFGFGGLDDASPCGQKFCFLGYMESKSQMDQLGQPKMIGPFGLGATICSVFVIIGIGYTLGLYYKLKSKNVIKIRNKSKELEAEFASALFQLGNRLGDGVPAEMAFDRVATTMQGTVSGNFFNVVAQNIRRIGMSVKEAIFNKEHGALVHFPSNLIESSMKVLVESAKKGPRVAAQALINISQYIKEMHKVNERLKDLLAEIISSMKSQINFMTPVISGIVVGITSMITAILGRLSSQMKSIASQGSGVGSAGAPNLVDMFGDGIPSYYFQIIVGLYVVQLIYVLSTLVNGIENGSDKLSERYELGKNLTKSTLLYVFLSLSVSVMFNVIAVTILSKTT